MNIISGEILIRAIEERDLNFLKDMVNDPEIEYKVLGWSFPVSDRRQREWMENQRIDELKCIVEFRNEPVGMITITSIDYKNSVAELGIKIKDDKNRQKGLGTDILKIVIDYCFNELNLNCLTAYILDYNLPSQKLFEKCGFSKEGVLRSRIYKRGTYHDVIVFSLLRKEQKHV